MMTAGGQPATPACGGHRMRFLTCAALLLPIGATAQPVGVYIGGALGPNFAGETQNRSTPTVTGSSGTTGSGFAARFNTGPVAVASLGYGFGNGVRTEVEANYRQNGVKQARFFAQGSPVGGYASGGDTRAYGLMVNAYYDIDTNYLGSGWGWIQPYVGVGIGWLNLDYRRFQASLGSAGQETALSGTSGAFAYQGIIGAAFPVEAVPGLAVTAEYRYLGAVSASFRGSVRSSGGGGTTLASYKVSPDVSHQSVMLGLRYGFETPPRPGVAANLPVGWSAPYPTVQARTYVVYFANDSAALDAAARRVITEAATNARTQPTTRVALQGRADRTAPAAYNQRLTERRVQNVAGELGRLGIPRQMITTSAVGYANEPAGRNAEARRVDIVLQ